MATTTKNQPRECGLYRATKALPGHEGRSRNRVRGKVARRPFHHRKFDCGRDSGVHHDQRAEAEPLAEDHLSSLDGSREDGERLAEDELLATDRGREHRLQRALLALPDEAPLVAATGA